jgi:nitrile hydratase
MQDFGPVSVEPDEPVFHDEWEGRVFGLTAAMSVHRLYTTDAFRHAIERMDPVHYLGSRYFEHWLTGLATLLVERGLIEHGELAERAGGPFPLARPARAPQRQPHPAGTRRGAAPFNAGDRVRVRDMHPRGHTRCPRYVRGRHGVVERCDGAFALPDAAAHGAQPRSEPTYCVRFEARELWGPEAEPNASVSVDLWHSHLEAA